MSKPQLPERGVWVPTWLLEMRAQKNDSLPPTVLDTWTMLRALANGSDTLEVTFDELYHITWKGRSPVMSHLAMLRDRCGLRFRTAGISLLQVLTFGSDSSHAPPIRKSGRSENQDQPDLKLESSRALDSRSKAKAHVKATDSPIRKSGRSENQDQPTPAPATTCAITDKYAELLGYNPGDWAEGESKAAKWIAAHYTVEQFGEAYRYYKSQKFWHDKRLTLRHLKTQIAEYFASKSGARNDITSSSFISDEDREDAKRLSN